MGLRNTAPDRKQKSTEPMSAQSDILPLGSESPVKDYMPGFHLSVRHQSPQLVKRRVKRTISRPHPPR